MDKRACTVYFSSKGANILKLLTKKLPNINFVNLEIQFGASDKDTYVPALEDNEALTAEIEILFADIGVISNYRRKLKNLKWVHTIWNGIDFLLKSFDKDEEFPKFTLTKQHGGFNADLICQYVIGYIIEIERGFFKCREQQNAKVWNSMGFHSTRYFPDITVGILGVGAIGKALAAVCKAHQLTVWGLTRTQHAVEDLSPHVDVYRTTENLMEFLTNCDYVVNLLPSTEETRDLLSGNMLQNCSAKKAVLINVGRGDIVDEESIVKAIENKWIGGAVLDTFVEEPLPTSSLLWSLPGVYITPHISGWSLSPQYIEFVAQSYVDNLERFLAGKPLHNVFDWERGY